VTADPFCSGAQEIPPHTGVAAVAHDQQVKPALFRVLYDVLGDMTGADVGVQRDPALSGQGFRLLLDAFEASVRLVPHEKGC